MTSALEPIGMTYKMPLQDVLRMVLLGNDERISAETAMRIGIVSEVVPLDRLWSRAAELVSRLGLSPAQVTEAQERAQKLKAPGKTGPIPANQVAVVATPSLQ